MLNFIEQLEDLKQKTLAEIDKLPVEKREEILKATNIDNVFDENLKKLKQKVDEFKH